MSRVGSPQHGRGLIQQDPVLVSRKSLWLGPWGDTIFKNRVQVLRRILCVPHPNFVCEVSVNSKELRAATLLVWVGVAQGQFPPTLSQYAPLNVSRDSTYFESPMELEVRHVLRALPYFGVFDHLAYRVDGSVVTLLGLVIRPELRDAAQSVVSTIHGVEHVNN